MGSDCLAYKSYWLRDHFWPTILSVVPLAHCVVCLSSVTFFIVVRVSIKGRFMTTIGVSEWMFLLVLAHLGCPGQNPESCKTVVCVWVCVCVSDYCGHESSLISFLHLLWCMASICFVIIKCTKHGQLILRKIITRSPAVARMADRTAPVVKLTLTLTGHNLPKTGTSPLNGPTWWAAEAKISTLTVHCVVCLSIVCHLSVMFCIVAKWYVLVKNCLKEWIGNHNKNDTDDRQTTHCAKGTTDSTVGVVRLFTPFWVNNRG